MHLQVKLCQTHYKILQEIGVKKCRFFTPIGEEMALSILREITLLQQIANWETPCGQSQGKSSKLKVV